MGNLFIDGRKDTPLTPMIQQNRGLFARLLYQFFLRLSNFSRRIEAFLIQRALRQSGIRYVDQIPTYTKKQELCTLYKLASASPKGARALEIGSHLGASSCYLAAGLEQVGGRLFCVDTWRNDAMPGEQQDTMAAFQKNISPLRHLVTVLRKNSHDLTTTDLEAPFDLIFIDGDHSYEAVRRDFELLHPWLTPNGIIAFHDFAHENHEGVTRVVGEALASGDWILAGLVDSLAWIKRVRWQQPVLSHQTQDDVILHYPTVTVLMSVYNGERYLREAIDSILGQTFTDFEFLIIDDGSTDNSRNIITSYDDPRIQLIDNKENIGLSKSLNKGLDLAQGIYIARQDADDISEPERLARQVSFMEKNLHVAMAGSWYGMIDEVGNPFGHWGDFMQLSINHIDLQWELLFFNPFVHSAVMIRKSQLLDDKVGFYNEDYHYAMDWELWFRIARRWPVTNIPEYLVCYRINSQSMTATYGEKTNEGTELSIEAITALLNQDRNNRVADAADRRKMHAILYEGDVSLIDMNAEEVFRVSKIIWQLQKAFGHAHQLNRRESERHRAKLRAYVSKRYIFLALSYLSRGRHSEANQLYIAGLRLFPPRFLTIKSARLLYRLLLRHHIRRVGSFIRNR